MKQSAAKTLGVAALGAAFAAAGAGAANAAPAVPDAGSTLDTVSQTLPAQDLSQTLPAQDLSQTLPAQNLSHAVPGASQALAQGQNQVGTQLSTVQPSAQKALADGPTTPLAGLLGGVPVKGMPTSQGLPLKGVQFSHP
jgi:hypothetical protein